MGMFYKLKGLVVYRLFFKECRNCAGFGIHELCIGDEKFSYSDCEICKGEGRIPRFKTNRGLS